MLNMKTEEKITLKIKSLYIGCYNVEGFGPLNWLTFIYDSNASDDELQRYFCNVVFYSVYREKIEKDAPVVVFELREGFAFSEKMYYKVIVSK